jgi:protein phosphatase PTC1
LWDVCSDQEAVDLVRNTQDPTVGAKALVDHALGRFSTDNLSCMIVRLNKSALITTSKDAAAAIGVEGDPLSAFGKISEAEKIVGEAKRKVETDGFPAMGVSGSNSGKGHDPKAIEEDAPGRVSMEKVVEEEPDLTEGEPGPEVDMEGANSVSPITRSQLKLPEGVPK